MGQLIDKVLGIGFIGSPFYILYLWDKHAPPRGRMWMRNMEVTKARRIIALVFGTSSFLFGILTFPNFVTILGFGLSAPLLSYAIGGKRVLRLIPDWREFYQDLESSTDKKL